jgi:hypothetical protein
MKVMLVLRELMPILESMTQPPLHFFDLSWYAITPPSTYKVRNQEMHSGLIKVFTHKSHVGRIIKARVWRRAADACSSMWRL